MFEALETNHGDKLPNQHFRRIFSKGFGFSETVKPDSRIYEKVLNT